MTGPAHIFDKPNRYIGKPEPRADAARLLQGRGRFVDDEKLPRMVHAAFVRSPHAHAKILSIDTEDARTSTGVIAIYTGADLAEHVTPYVGTLTHMAGLRSAPQNLL
jgi:carbon-monoxide dehydrogenase large subunit